MTAGQEVLLKQLQSGGRIWRVRERFTLFCPWVSEPIALTELTVRAMVAAGVIRETETHGADRSCYELTEMGREFALNGPLGFRITRVFP